MQSGWDSSHTLNTDGKYDCGSDVYSIGQIMSDWRGDLGNDGEELKALLLAKGDLELALKNPFLQDTPSGHPM